MTDQKFCFDDEFQLGIFEIMMVDSGFCSKASLLLKPEYFKNEFYAYFFNTICYLQKEYQSLPSQMQLKNEIMKLSIKDRDKYLLIFQKIVKAKINSNHTYIKDNLTKFCKKAMNLHINEILRKNNNEDPEHVNQMVSKLIDDQKNIDFNTVNCQSTTCLSKMMQSSSEASKSLIPTYLPSIDRALGGGVPRGTLTVALSGTNVGKSIFLINWSNHLIKHGFKVFYVNLEGYENQPMLRLASRNIGAFMGDVRNNRLNDIELQKKNDFEKRYENSIKIFHNASFDFKLETLIPILTQMKAEFDYDVLMIDYGQILRTKQRYSEIRHEQSYVHRALSSISSDLNIAVVTVAQGNRETQEKNQKGFGLVRMGDISECFEITRAAAQVFSLNRSDRDCEMEVVRILLDKQRDGQTGVIEVCKSNFSRLAMYGDHTEGLGFLSMNDYIKESANNGQK